MIGMEVSTIRVKTVLSEFANEWKTLEIEFWTILILIDNALQPLNGIRNIWMLSFAEVYK